MSVVRLNEEADGNAAKREVDSETSRTLCQLSRWRQDRPKPHISHVIVCVLTRVSLLFQEPGLFNSKRDPRTKALNARPALRDLVLKQLLKDLKGRWNNLSIKTRRGRSLEGLVAIMMNTQTRSFGIQCDSKRSTGVQTKRLGKDGRFLPLSFFRTTALHGVVKKI